MASASALCQARVARRLLAAARSGGAGGRVVSTRDGWIIIAVGLDLAAWAGLRRIPAPAGNPGSASALALCWVHAFVLPHLFGRPRRGLLQLVATAGTGTLAAPFAVFVRFLLGLLAGLLAFLIGLAFSGPCNGGAVCDPPGPLLQAVQNVLWHIMTWSGPAAGTAVAAVAAVGLAAGRAASSPVLVSALGRACSSVVFLPGWLVDARRPGWREPALLMATGSLNTFFVDRQAITRNRSG